MAFVASEDDDEDDGADAEVKDGDVQEEEEAKTFELVPNRDILIHKPQVGAIYNRFGFV